MNHFLLRKLKQEERGFPGIGKKPSRALLALLLLQNPCLWKHTLKQHISILCIEKDSNKFSNGYKEGLAEFP